MRQRIIIAVLLFCSFGVFAEAVEMTERITKERAIQIAQKQFSGQDVDYYIDEDSTKGYWNIFVDAEPTKGWLHDCYILNIPVIAKIINGEVQYVSNYSNKPPFKGDYTPINDKNSYGLKAKQKPYVSKTITDMDASTDAKRTYAIILSGGMNHYANYERYWNDCSFIYQTLVNKYGVPKGNIYPIMSDGTDSYEDVNIIGGEFASQNLDLDGDGLNDIELAATKANIAKTLSYLANKLQKDDHLFLYVIDHGGSDDLIDSFICLWGDDEVLHDYELAEMLTPLCNKFVNVSVVLGQCYSGGFINDLTKVGCVVATASKSDQYSYSCGDIPYDEFVYHWTCAVNGADHNQKLCNKSADIDNNGRVTMEEAFIYAKENDRKSETPQYVSTPNSLGEDLSFDHIVPSVDLFIKDTPLDIGIEPKYSVENLVHNIPNLFVSPSIWVRRKPDGIYAHQNPYFSEWNEKNYIYVRIHNRGKEDYSTGKYVHIYCAKAATGITNEVWKGREVTSLNVPTGGHLGASLIKPIMAGDSIDVMIEWPRTFVEDSLVNEFNYCLMAKIMDSDYDDGYLIGKEYFDVAGKKGQAQKNVILISNLQLNKYQPIYFRNISSDAQSYNLEMIPVKSSDLDFYNKGYVVIELDKKINDAWIRGGNKSTDVEFPYHNIVTGSQTARFTSPKSQISNINLEANELGTIKLKFIFTSPTTSGEKYTFDLIQQKENGEMVGGERFIVQSPKNPVLADSTIIGIDSIGLNAYKLYLQSPQFSSFSWLDRNDHEIGSSESVNVTPTINNNEYKVFAIDEEGNSVFSSVSLTTKKGIKSVSSSESSGNIYIELLNEAPLNSNIKITSVLDGLVKKTEFLNPGLKEFMIDSNSLDKGVYIIMYYIDGEVIDQRKINLK